MPPPPTRASQEAAPSTVDGAADPRWFLREVHAHDAQLKSWLRGSFPAVRDVDDVVQESYLRIWKAHAARPISSAKAFLFKVARRIALDVLRSRRRSPIDAVSDLSAIGVLETEPDPAASAGLQEKIDLLADAIASLPEKRREIVILRKLQRLPQREVAAHLDLSERTVENQLYRGVLQCEAFLRARGVHSLYAERNRLDD